MTESHSSTSRASIPLQTASTSMKFWSAKNSIAAYSNFDLSPRRADKPSHFDCALRLVNRQGNVRFIPVQGE